MKFENEKFNREKYYSIGFNKQLNKYMLGCVIAGSAGYKRYYEISEEEFRRYDTDPSEMNALVDKISKNNFNSHRFLFSDISGENSNEQSQLRQIAMGQGEVERKPTEEERIYLLRRAIPWIIFGALIAVSLGIQAFMILKGYVTEGKLVRGGNVENTLVVVFILSTLVVFGVALIYKGVKLLVNIQNMLVTQVYVSRVFIENYSLFYKGEFKLIANGRKKTMFASVAFGDVRSIRNSGKAMLYYVPDKLYMLGRFKEKTSANHEMPETTKVKSEKLMHMDEKQKTAVLHKITRMAWMDIIKTIMIPCLGGLVVYIVLLMTNDSSSEQGGHIMLSVFLAIMLFLWELEPFLKNIGKLIQVKKLKKVNVYWIVISVTQCTCSMNIFERWYRYAHFIYEGRTHKEWMMIGRNPINKVTCLVSADDKSKPYAYMYNWFRGILY